MGTFLLFYLQPMYLLVRKQECGLDVYDLDTARERWGFSRLVGIERWSIVLREHYRG